MATTVAEMKPEDLKTLNDLINQFTHTTICIPFTTNLQRAQLPSCLLVPAGEGGLPRDSVALCHQMWLAHWVTRFQSG